MRIHYQAQGRRHEQEAAALFGIKSFPGEGLDTASSPRRVGGEYFLYTRKGHDYYLDAGGASFRVNQKTGLKQYPGRRAGWEPPQRRWWHRRSIRGLYFRLEFKPRELWVGARWEAGDINYLGHNRRWHLWICIVPSLAFRLSWDRPLGGDR